MAKPHGGGSEKELVRPAVQMGLHFPLP